MLNKMLKYNVPKICVLKTRVDPGFGRGGGSFRGRKLPMKCSGVIQAKPRPFPASAPEITTSDPFKFRRHAVKRVTILWRI